MLRQNLALSMQVRIDIGLVAHICLILANVGRMPFGLAEPGATFKRSLSMSFDFL
jgi:hypothetical protein